MQSAQEEAMNGYVCFWKGKRTEVQAYTSYEAQGKAMKYFGKHAHPSSLWWALPVYASVLLYGSDMTSLLTCGEPKS